MAIQVTFFLGSTHLDTLLSLHNLVHFVRSLVPWFGLLMMFALVDPLTYMLCHKHIMYSSDSPLLSHLPTS